MTLYEFSTLTDNEKTSLLYEQGVYIGKLKQESKTIILFQFESFYVEIFYKKYRKFITHINCFSSTEQLYPYLEQIDVAELIQSPDN